VTDHSSAVTPFYIQAIQGHQGVFLCTNLPNITTAQNTAAGVAWLIGRSPHCAIVLPYPTISRCHAMIGHDAQQGFYILDVGSRNGTCLNQQRLITTQRYSLQDGDRVAISQIQIRILLQP
jgi:pSer/pThr/pTyr-binding forkhead associated (FHA) protein